MSGKRKTPTRIPGSSPLKCRKENISPQSASILFPKKGGKWKDKSVALHELTAEWLEEGKKPVGLSLANPRADFSQRGWEVAKAIDGNKCGLGLFPKASSHTPPYSIHKNTVTGGRQG